MLVPLHQVHLVSELITADVVVGVRTSLPIPGLSRLACAMTRAITARSIGPDFLPLSKTFFVQHVAAGGNSSKSSAEELKTANVNPNEIIGV